MNFIKAVSFIFTCILAGFATQSNSMSNQTQNTYARILTNFNANLTAENQDLWDYVIFARESSRHIARESRNADSALRTRAENVANKAQNLLLNHAREYQNRFHRMEAIRHAQPYQKHNRKMDTSK